MHFQRFFHFGEGAFEQLDVRFVDFRYDLGAFFFGGFVNTKFFGIGNFAYLKCVCWNCTWNVCVETVPEM